MAYESIFNVKPNTEHKKEFCQRIVSLLNEIAFVIDGYRYNDGKQMINAIFKHSKLNNGYIDINDLLNESDKHYRSIFELFRLNNASIDSEEILVNIDILFNCLFNFESSKEMYFWNSDKAAETLNIIDKAVEQYLLSSGYKLQYIEEKEQFFIVPNEIAVDIEKVADNKIKNEIVNFYNYKNANDIEEKKKIMLILIGKLESRKSDIGKIMGSKIEDTFSNYANNFNLRHNNISSNYKKCYNKSIAALSEEEILKWYDYIFAFMINIYLCLNDLKDVNINNGYN